MDGIDPVLGVISLLAGIATGLLLYAWFGR